MKPKSMKTWPMRRLPPEVLLPVLFFAGAGLAAGLPLPSFPPVACGLAPGLILGLLGTDGGLPAAGFDPATGLLACAPGGTGFLGGSESAIQDTPEQKSTGLATLRRSVMPRNASAKRR